MTKSQKQRVEDYLNTVKTDPVLYRTLDRVLSEGEISFEQAVYTAVFGPALLRFVEWVLDKAQEKGIKRLYFLARDGYPMFLVAKSLCETEKRWIECRYLYGSRYAWRLPQFSVEGEACLEKICRGGIDVTFEKLMKRGGLTDVEAYAVAKELGVEEDYRSILSYQEIMQLKQRLKESKSFLPWVYAHSEKAYANTLAYFKQEGLFDGISYALVDSGWTGSLQQTLQQLLAEEGYQKSLEGFYFGLYELPAGVDKERYHSYYFEPKTGLKRKVYFSNCLYEAVYSAPHGMTVAYEKKDGGYGPVFYKENSLNQAKMERYALWLEQITSEYCRQRTAKQESKRSMKETSRMIYRLFRKLMGNPLGEEAELYGSLLFSDDVTEEHTQTVATQFTVEELKNQRFFTKALIMLGVKKGTVRDSAWPEGSIVKSECNVRCYLRHAAFYKYIVYLRKAMKL